MSRARVLVVLLDAVDKDLLRDWARQGLLPAFADLLGSGASATMLAPLGMHPAGVWPSLYTGGTPARHGRHADRQIRPGTYETFRCVPAEVRGEPFWEPIARAGRRVAVIDVPESRLASGLDVHVVDWLPHTVADGFATAPASLRGEIVDRFGTADVALCDHARLATAKDFARFRDGLIARVRRKAELSRHLLARQDWDLFVTTFTESHCVGHRCWHLHDPTHPWHDARLAEALGDPLRPVYRAIDEGVGDLVAVAGRETVVIVASDLGMGPNFNGAHLLDEVLFRLGQGAPPTEPSVAWRALRWCRRRLPLAVRSHLEGVTRAAVDRVWPAFDARWKCFAVNNGEVFGGIRVNLESREPNGNVRQGKDYDDFCLALAGDLLAVENADTGRPAVRRVLRTAEHYDGPRIDALPDLLVEWESEAALDAVRSPKIGTIRRPYRGPRSGHHRRGGFLLARGPHVEPGSLDRPVDVTDLAPTVAALLGVELKEVDGRPIAAIAGETERGSGSRVALG